MHLRREQEEIDEVRGKERQAMLAHKGYSGFSVAKFAKECSFREDAPEEREMQGNTTGFVEGEVGEEMSNEDFLKCMNMPVINRAPEPPLSLSLCLCPSPVSVTVCMSVRVLRVKLGSLCIEFFVLAVEAHLPCSSEPSSIFSGMCFFQL